MLFSCCGATAFEKIRLHYCLNRNIFSHNLCRTTTGRDGVKCKSSHSNAAALFVMANYRSRSPAGSRKRFNRHILFFSCLCKPFSKAHRKPLLSKCPFYYKRLCEKKADQNLFCQKTLLLFFSNALPIKLCNGFLET